MSMSEIVVQTLPDQFYKQAFLAGFLCLATERTLHLTILFAPTSYFDHTTQVRRYFVAVGGLIISSIALAVLLHGYTPAQVKLGLNELYGWNPLLGISAWALLAAHLVQIVLSVFFIGWWTYRPTRVIHRRLNGSDVISERYMKRYYAELSKRRAQR